MKEENRSYEKTPEFRALLKEAQESIHRGEGIPAEILRAEDLTRLKAAEIKSAV